MSKKLFGLALGAVLLALSFPAEAQQPGKVRRLGVLSQGRPSPLFEAFRQGLRGWVEGQNLAIEWRFAEGKAERLPALAAELVRLGVDVIVTTPTRPTVEAKNVTSTTSIVFVGVADPVESGLVASLARPGGNVTGLTSISLELSGKRLELLKEALAGVRVAVLWNVPSQGAVIVFREIEVASRQLGVELQNVGVRGPDELQGAFESATRARATALIVIDEPVLSSYRTQILDLAVKHRLPIISQFREFVEAGGLMAYGPSLPDMYRRAATYVDKILKGTKPADLPVERPTKFELIINLKTAKQIGLTIPPNVLARADRVIK